MNEKLVAIVKVCCEGCSRSTGKGTPIGEMCLMPADLGGKWGWVELKRRRIWRGLPDRSVQRAPMDLVFSGGVSATCRRCGAKPRMSIRSLAQRAEMARGNGDAEILVS